MNVVRIDGVDLAVADGGTGTERPAAGELLLLKPRWMIERYQALAADHCARDIVELGICEGGSTAFLALLFRPQRLVAFDLRPDRVSALDRFVSDRGLGDVVHAHYGVDQADRGRLEEVVGDAPLDLVVDDASHRYAPTVASFNVLFPRLRPGGLFVIEDWSWEHQLDAVFDAGDPIEVAKLVAGKKPVVPLSRLVLEVVLMAAYAPGIVTEIVELRQGWFVVRRGDAPLDASFELGACYGALGRSLLRM